MEKEVKKKEAKKKDKAPEKEGKTIKVVYAEPPEYFPIETRRKYKLGEFAERKEDKK